MPRRRHPEPTITNCLLRRGIVAALAAFVIVSGGCGSSGPGGVDAGPAADAGPTPDAGVDAGFPDGGVLDGGNIDAGFVDAGIDPNNPNNPTKDTDCDGLSDAEELSTTYSGRLKTNPGNPDTDGDGIPDGVEVGRTSSVDPACTSFVGDADPSTRTDPTKADTDEDGLPDGVEDVNHNGRVDTGETDPLNRDSDADLLLDGHEVNVSMTDPLKRDTDGDGVPDNADNCPTVVGTISNNGCPGGDGGALTDTDGDGLSDQAEMTIYGTNPNSDDTDGDGLKDGAEVLVHGTNPTRVDSDCDGLTDADEVNTRMTDPTKPDTDGDGLPDGLEVGVTTNPDPTNCPGVVLDQCAGTTTDPLKADTDGDGLADGVEDANQNGCVDTGRPMVPDEKDPNNPNDNQGPVTEACSQTQLRQVLFKAAQSYNVQTARLPVFAEVTDITVGGVMVGALFFDATNGVAAFAISKTPAGATAVAEESAGRANFDSVGTVSAPITQSFSSWDAVPGVLARYEWAGSADIKTKVNDAVRALLGDPAGLSGLFTDTAALAGPHKLHVEYLRRSATQAVVVGAVARTTGFDVVQEIRLQDVANGSALADAHDETSVQCDRFSSAAPAKVDFLWVIDNSGSMSDDQDALTAAAQAMADQLASAQIDWRMAVSYTDSHLNDPLTCTDAPGPGRRVICPFTRDIDLFRNGSAECAYVQAGTCGSGTERGFDGARAAIEAFLAGTGCAAVTGGECNLRTDAQLVVIFFSDTGEQTTTNPPGQGTSTNTAWTNYFSDYDPTTAGAQRALVNGILCPLRPPTDNCTDNEDDPATYDRYSQVISNLGGVEGSIRDSDQAALPDTIRSMISAVIGQVSPFQLTKPPISATIKVAIEGGSNDVPRNPTNGFDYNGAANRITLFGSHIPPTAGLEIAVSYRYWVDREAPAECPECPEPLVCNPVTSQCECPPDCGSPAPSPRHQCNTQTCEWQCAPDCNGTCGQYETCSDDSCSCVCAQSVTCAPGFRFNGNLCDCVCDVEALACDTVHFDLDTQACTCTCKSDCGGCSESSPCNLSLCRCVPR